MPKPDPQADPFADLDLSPPDLAMVRDLRELFHTPHVAPAPPIDWQQPPSMADHSVILQYGSSPRSPI